MATVYDILNSLTTSILPMVYPNGVNNPSVINANVSIFPGWPIPKVLDEVLRSGNAVISLFPSQLEHNTTRGLSQDWFEIINDGVTGIAGKEVKRQNRIFQITIWASEYNQRSVLSDIIDSNLSDLIRLTFSDTTTGNINYSHEAILDDLEKEGIYRHDLFYDVEFSTIVKRTEFAVLQNRITIDDMVNVTDVSTGIAEYTLTAFIDGELVDIAQLRYVDKNGNIVVDIKWPDTIQGGAL